MTSIRDALRRHKTTTTPATPRPRTVAEEKAAWITATGSERGIDWELRFEQERNRALTNKDAA